MKNYLVADRYAQAFSQTIPDSNDLESVLASLNDFSQLYTKSDDLHSVLANPVIELAIRRNVIDELLKVIEAPAAMTNLLHTLLERGRISILPDVAELFGRIVDERLNRVTAEVTTAVPITPEQRQQLQASLSQFSGKQVETRCVVDPDVIGGVVAVLDGLIIDGSLRRHLERLKHTLLYQDMEHH